MTPNDRSLPGNAGGPVRALRAWLSRLLARPLVRRKPRDFRAAIVKLDRIGDAILAVAAIRAILQRHGEAQCLLIVTPLAAPLLAAEFPATPQLVLPIEVGHKRLLWEGRKARKLLCEFNCAEAICLRHQRSDWDELVLAWVGARRTYVLDEARAARESADRRTFSYRTGERRQFVEPAIADSEECRELERHRQLLARVLDRPVAAAEMIPRFERVGAKVKRSGIVVTPFGTAAIRDFPEPLLLAAVQAIRAHGLAPITLLGNGPQQPRLRRLAETLRAGGITNVECAAPAGVVAFAEAVAGAELVLTVETATAHLAAAFDRPAVILIGGGHYGEFGPWHRSAHQVWVTHQLECFGCSWQCIFPEPYCLTRISPDSVRGAVAQLLQGAART
jgi:ADP-heptose:LPS heptosyltransferase